MGYKNNYRIVCHVDNTWVVEEYIEGNWKGDWYVVYHCKNKNEAGLTEARQWIEKEGGKQ